MALSVDADSRGKAEKLTFLVISHLATKFASGDWMSVENTVESSAYWAESVQRDDDVVGRVMVASMALSIAKAIEGETGLTLNGSALASIFDSNLRLDFACALTRDIFNRCLGVLTLR
ncbi:hypothetical protein [Caballeronia novacaledonica]|uniref:hypothetical protein n=1 Tax=Caballeronia novacaledonica TaxID=1544861 RepID=UPI000D12D1EA|nr:hypothetical protein [Caballeronia novacaledonica]